MPQASQEIRKCKHLWGHSIFGYILGVVLQLLHLTREVPRLPN